MGFMNRGMPCSGHGSPDAVYEVALAWDGVISLEWFYDHVAPQRILLSYLLINIHDHISTMWLMTHFEILSRHIIES